jgi:hypothetical protein
MSFSMRALVAAHPSVPAETRALIAVRDPGSTARLMALGLDECEAAELLDEPCLAYGDWDSDCGCFAP